MRLISFLLIFGSRCTSPSTFEQQLEVLVKKYEGGIGVIRLKDPTINVVTGFTLNVPRYEKYTRKLRIYASVSECYVYKVAGSTGIEKYVAKYQVWDLPRKTKSLPACFTKIKSVYEKLHDLEKEYYLMQYLSDVSVRSLGMSKEEAGDLMPETLSSNLQLFRVVLMESVGISVSWYLRGMANSLPLGLYFVHCLVFAFKTISLLEYVHSKGVVHNDVRLGNIAFKDPNLTSPDPFKHELVIFDWGESEFIEISKMCKNVMLGKPTTSSTLLSPWRLDGYRPGRRDDVYRAIEMILFSLFDQNWFTVDQKLEDCAPSAATPTEATKKCKYANVFDKIEMPDKYFNPSSLSKDIAKETLKRTMSTILALSDVDSEPPYKEIRNELTSLIQIVNPDFNSRGIKKNYPRWNPPIPKTNSKLSPPELPTGIPEKDKEAYPTLLVFGIVVISILGVGLLYLYYDRILNCFKRERH
jgi:serine/threonine protein kinase